ncbi:MAG TPA: Ig-like domain-containing protein [Actinomycetes bacterium]|nr:Ig-like domain-containing protein [Actinomycetes bacterium]
MVAGLKLAPQQATILQGDRQTYTAEGFDATGHDLGEVTAQTVFTITPSGACQRAICTPTKAGDHTVTGTPKDNPTIGGTAKLQVLPRQPSISSVTPGSTLPARSVEVRGNTGSCNRAGTLTFHGMTDDVSMDVTADENGNFVARFTVPTGIFPRVYKLELTVDCNRRLQSVQTELTVINLAPVAVDDLATTTQDTPVAIAVAANDRNPDPDTGYQTIVVEHRSPPHGTIQVRSDRTIVYTPETGFLGRDQFQYSLCDNLINAAGQADCGTATVTVAVNPRTSTTTTGVPATGVPATGVPPTTTTPSCAPSAGDIRSFQVTPIEGAGGAGLRITTKGDRNLAPCLLRILLGGSPLGPAVRVGSDGSISAQRSVPNNAKPGISTVALATTGGQILAETPFKIIPFVPPWWARGLLKLLIGAGAFLAGALAQAAIRRWGARQEERKDGQVPKNIRTEPHTGSAAVAVEPNGDSTQTFTVRLEPHHDPGTQTVQEVTG